MTVPHGARHGTRKSLPRNVLELSERVCLTVALNQPDEQWEDQWEDPQARKRIDDSSPAPFESSSSDRSSEAGAPTAALRRVRTSR